MARMKPSAPGRCLHRCGVPVLRRAPTNSCDSLFWKIVAVAPAQKTLVVSFSGMVLRWPVSRLMLHPHVRRARCGHSRQKQIFLTLCAEFDLALEDRTLHRT